MELLTGTFMKIYTGIYGGSGGWGGAQRKFSIVDHLLHKFQPSLNTVFIFQNYQEND